MHVQVRVDETQTPHLGRIAQLAGVTPPAQEENSKDTPEATSRMSKLRADEGSVTPRKQKQSATDRLHVQNVLYPKTSDLNAVASSKLTVFCFLYYCITS